MSYCAKCGQEYATSIHICPRESHGVSFEKELLIKLMEAHGVKERACARHLIHQRNPRLDGCPTCELIAKVLIEHPDYEPLRLTQR